MRGASGGVQRVRRAQIALGCALAMMGVSVIGVAAAQGGGHVVAQGGGAVDPLQLFEPMMPVFTHERCANCHGGVDVFSDQSHGGGALNHADVPLVNGDMLPGDQGNQTCTKSECHDENAATSVWRLAPKRMSFGGKDALTLCKQMRTENGLTTGDPAAVDAFMRHLENDQLIGFGFEGYRAQLANMPDAAKNQADDAEPPPMDRDAFVQLASRWVDEGHARCGPWSGTIVGTISQHMSSPLVEQDANIQVDITVDGGEAKAHFTMTGRTTSKGQGCYLRIDDVSVDQKDVPVTLNILVANDLSNIPGFQAPTLPAMPPGFPAPPNILGQNTYTLILTLPPVQGIDRFEEHNPTVQGGCPVTRGDQPFSLSSLAGSQISKPLDPNDRDHLHDTDTQQANGGSVTWDWDLNRI